MAVHSKGLPGMDSEAARLQRRLTIKSNSASLYAAHQEAVKQGYLLIVHIEVSQRVIILAFFDIVVQDSTIHKGKRAFQALPWAELLVRIHCRSP